MVRDSIGDQPGYLRLSAGQRRHSVAALASHDDPSAHPQVSQAAADASSVPFGAKRQIQLESSPQSGDATVAIGPGEAPTVVLERRSERNATRALLEEHDRPFEIFEPACDKAAHVGLDGRDRLDARVELQTSSNRRKRLTCQVTVS